MVVGERKSAGHTVTQGSTTFPKQAVSGLLKAVSYLLKAHTNVSAFVRYHLRVSDFLPCVGFSAVCRNYKACRCVGVGISSKRWIVLGWNRTTDSPVHSGWRHVKLCEGAVILHEDLSFLIADVIAARTNSILGLSRLYRPTSNVKRMEMVSKHNAIISDIWTRCWRIHRVFI
jgi:hypothetical protein